MDALESYNCTSTVRSQSHKGEVSLQDCAWRVNQFFSAFSSSCVLQTGFSDCLLWNHCIVICKALKSIQT